MNFEKRHYEIRLTVTESDTIKMDKETKFLGLEEDGTGKGIGREVTRFAERADVQPSGIFYTSLRI
jgi:hypothetical protein